MGVSSRTCLAAWFRDRRSRLHLARGVRAQPLEPLLSLGSLLLFSLFGGSPPSLLILLSSCFPSSSSVTACWKLRSLLRGPTCVVLCDSLRRRRRHLQLRFRTLGKEAGIAAVRAAARPGSERSFLVCGTLKVAPQLKAPARAACQSRPRPREAGMW